MGVRGVGRAEIDVRLSERVGLEGRLDNTIPGEGLKDVGIPSRITSAPLGSGASSARLGSGRLDSGPAIP